MGKWWDMVGWGWRRLEGRWQRLVWGKCGVSIGVVMNRLWREGGDKVNVEVVGKHNVVGQLVVDRVLRVSNRQLGL